MQLRKRLIHLLALTVLGTGVALGTPTLNVSPTTITTTEAGTVELAVGSVVGSQVYLRLYNDANGNGVIDAPADNMIWADVVADNVDDWSPGMFSDTNIAVGAVTIDARLFTPLTFPYSAGSFIWEAEDTNDSSTQTATFTITQAAQTQSVAGRARDSGTMLGVPGAFVLLLPLCEVGDETHRVYSAFADENGDYLVQVPAAVACRDRVVVALRPGYMTPFLGQPNPFMDGTSQHVAQDPTMTPGDWVASGKIEYSSGPASGSGIPGTLVAADFNDGLPMLSVGFTDENGDYSLSVIDGEWAVESPEDGIDTRGAVSLEDSTSFMVSGGPAAISLLTLPAANSFFQGTLYDDMGVPVPGHPLFADRQFPCDPECYSSQTYTRADGTYTLGAVGPTGPATYDYSVGLDDPLTGLVGQVLECETISDGDTLGGRDIDHLTPTRFITGTVEDTADNLLTGACLYGRAFDTCVSYVSAAVTTCDGSYSLPVIDNDWFVETETDDFTAFYKGLSPESVSRFLTVAGADVDDVNFIVGPWRSLPRITGWDSDDTTVGSHILLFAYGFSLGSAPQVFFDAVPATVVAYSTTRGGIVVQVPGGLTPGTYDVTVVNTDLGETSPPACIEVAAGTFTPVCTLNGKTTDMGGNLADVIVVADNGGSFIRGVVTDGNGDWSMSLDAAGIYEVDLLPPPGSGVVDGYYDLTCGVTQNHFFDAGFEISGQVISQSGEGVSGAGVGAADGFDFYDTFTITDEDGFFSLIVWAGTYDVGFDAPSESHFTGANGVQLTVGAPAQMGQIVMDQGSLFTGRVVDGDDNGILAEVSVFRQDNMMQVDAVGTESCEGRFNFALPDASYGLDILDVTGVGVQDARVSWINLNGDQSADFDFALFDPSSLAPATTAPEITWIDPSPSLQQGQPVILSSGNLGGAVVDVLFSDGVGGFVNGTSTAVDASRGRVATKVPAGTASGQMKLRVDGMDSRLVPYTLLPGLFSAGGLTVGGSVSGTGTGNSFVIVSWKDLSADCDDDDGIVVDYGFADGGGNYGPLSHPGGEIEVAFLPPDGTILVSASEFRSGVIGNITVDTTLVNGLAVTARILDDGMNPVKDARLYYEGDGPGNYDEKLTDANGDVTLHMSAGDWFFGVIPPARSRLLEAEFQQMIAGPFNFGDQQMTRGVLTSSAIQKDFDGSPLAGEPAEANGIFDPFPFYAETFSGLDGRFRMPVEAGVLYRARVEVTDDTLADRRYGRTSNVAYDDIAYPALKSGPAGAIGGLVRGADTMTPLEDISVAAYYEDPMNPGSPSIFTSGFASTCVDGTYQIKVDEGPHLVEFNDFNSGNYVSEWYDDEVCVDNAAIVVVTEGNTTTVDADVQLAGTITGIVRDSGVPIAGATICATSVMVDACYQACTPPTDGSGMYSLSVPPATDYVVSAFEPMLGTQCYNGFESCSGSNPVSVTAGMTTPDIDFSFGCSFDDDDMDGVDECSGDCDDSDPDNYPGNTEVCDGQDNDCDLDVDDDDAGVTGQPLWYQDLDADGAGDPGVSLAACAMPVVYVSSNDDCDPADGTIYPGAPEVNDGIDNNCDGDDGFGLIDEISGMAGFFNLGDLNEFSWPAQSGASMYKVARSTSGDFIDPSVTFTTVQNWWSDPTSPAVGQVLYYVVRSIAPNDGSWGNESSGTERDVNVLPNGDLEDWSGASNLSIWEEVSVGGTFAQETDPAHISRGGRAARLTRTGAGGIILFQRNLPLTPGQDYTLSFKAKFSAIEANAVEARLVNITAGQDLQLNGTWAPPVTFRNFALDTNYQTISIPFTVDAGFAPTDELRVILRHNNGTAIGTMLWLDDVRIEE